MRKKAAVSCQLSAVSQLQRNGETGRADIFGGKFLQLPVSPILCSCFGYAALGLLLAGCGVPHLEPYVERHRDYKLPSSSAHGEEALSAGSLWRDGKPPTLLFTDQRALRENDLVVVKVEEQANSNRTANTDMIRNSSASLELSAFLNLAKTGGAQSNTSGDGKIGGASQSQFQGDGNSQRTEQLTATVPAIVRKVLPNGNLFIEGHRAILVNSEEHHFYISGVVRPIDIDQDNSVKSSAVADAEIEFSGRGDLSDNTSQSWFSKVLKWLRPL